MNPTRANVRIRLFLWFWCPAFFLWGIWWAAFRITEARWGWAAYHFACAMLQAAVLTAHEAWYTRLFRGGGRR